MSFANFGATMDAASFLDLACTELTIPYEKHGYGYET